ncbi:MAG: type I glyceraldehyde-3-phosphate dehydrogenase [Candidatus Berkelbacteria bacterium]|nr:type I glyceraldehyde-3-phosphate dehydrogenase [Candidatus Berkelbacteria bacterium]
MSEDNEVKKSKATRVAINGFGRIGRQAFRAMLEKLDLNELDHSQIELVCVNDLTDSKTLAHLLKYDSVYGILQKDVDYSDKPSNRIFAGEIYVDDLTVGVTSEPDPTKLPWKKLDIDVVIESTGRFTDKETAGSHIKAGAKKVIITAPAKGGSVGTYVIGVNMDEISKKENIISNASCTTNCIAPVIAIMQKNFKIKKSLMTTVHAYTADQSLVDGPHKDLRRARSAAINTIPTTTGAAIAATEALPELKSKFDGLSIRVPVPVGSISDITMLVSREVTVEEVNDAIKRECQDPKWRGIMTYTEEPLVSSDIIGNPHSAIVDLALTQVVDKDLVKVVAWYDNEWGYSNRLVEQAIILGKILEAK